MQAWQTQEVTTSQLNLPVLLIYPAGRTGGSDPNDNCANVPFPALRFNCNVTCLLLSRPDFELDLTQDLVSDEEVYDGAPIEPGAEVYSIATAEDQARLVYDASTQSNHHLKSGPLPGQVNRFGSGHVGVQPDGMGSASQGGD